MKVANEMNIPSVGITHQTEEKYSLILLLAENGIGSILHTFKFPFSGHILSINQIGLMSRLAFETKNIKNVINFSIKGSLLKSLSPAGKKLTPMLAILSQGLIFSFPFILFGTNILSLILGILFSSLWAFIQSLIILWLIFGKSSLEIFNYFALEVQKVLPSFKEYLVFSFIFIVLLKFFLALSYSYKLLKLSDNQFIDQFKKFEPYVQRKKAQHWMKRIEWMYLFALLLCLFYFFKTESSDAKNIWIILRPIAGFILFKALNRTQFFTWLISKLKFH